MDRNLYRTRLDDIRLSGVGLGLPQDERFRNDMTKTGRFCPKDGREMELVSNSTMHVCHWCGGQFKIDEKGEITEVQFEGFE